MPKRIGSGKALEQYLIANVGRILRYDELQEAANGASEWGRRLRELRDEKGYAIKSHKDDASLKPGEYRIDNLERRPVERRMIDQRLRAQVLSRAGGVCEWCGAVAGKPHGDYPEKLTHLQASHIIDKAKGGTDTLDNLRALCSFCNEGASVVTAEAPRDVQLFALIRKAPMSVQREVYRRLGAVFAASSP